MQKKLSDITTTPFIGGAILKHASEAVLIPSGGYSAVQNFRNTHPGFKKRLGCAKQHSTADSTNKVCSLFQFSKGSVSEKYTFAQMSDGDVLQATTTPPGVTTGVFGSEVYSGTAASNPASWAISDDILLYANTVDPPQTFVGSRYVKKFIVYVSAAAIPSFPSEGVDYTNEVTGISSNPAVLDSLSTLAAYDCLFICTDIPCDSLTWTVSKANGNAAVMQWKYNKNGTWTAVSGFTDNTIASAGKTLGQTGTMVCTLPTDHTASMMYGVMGYWHQLSLASGALDAEVEITSLKYDSDWVTMPIFYDGQEIYAIECQTTDGTSYKTWGANEITFPNGTTTIYVSSADPLAAIHIELGKTDAQKLMTIDVQPSTPWVEGDIIVGETSLQEAEIAYQVSATTYAIINKTGNFTSGEVIGPSGNTADQGAGYPSIASLHRTSTTYYWNGSAWTDSSESDGTLVVDDSFAQSGWITWGAPTDEKPQTFRNTQYKAYWYKILFSGAKSNETVVSSIRTVPRLSINDYGACQCVGSWKDRAAFVFVQNPSYVQLSATGSPYELVGNDTGIWEMGDGRNNKIVNLKPLNDKLVAWQEEKGTEGGCVSYLSGDNIENINKTTISNKVGTMNAKSVAIVDGVETGFRTDEIIKAVAYFISRNGIFITDGNSVRSISGDISHFFDMTYSGCIRTGYESEHWICYDSTYKILRLGLVTGASATLPNTFLVYDIRTNTWATDSLGQEFSCMIEVEAGSGTSPVVQIAGGVDDGTVYVTNTGTDDVSTAIDAYATMELDAKGKVMRLGELLLRAKSQSAGSVTVTPYVCGVAGSALTLAQTAAVTNYQHRRNRVNMNIVGDHLALKFQNATAAQSCHLLDCGLAIDIYEEQ